MLFLQRLTMDRVVRDYKLSSRGALGLLGEFLLLDLPAPHPVFLLLPYCQEDGRLRQGIKRMS
jgi:hypothetical protein